MKKYVAGLDGGGTKTAVTITELSGAVVHCFNSGAINLNGQDAESIALSFKEIFNTIADYCGGLDNCLHVCIGAAGVSNPSVKSSLERFTRDSGYMNGLSITGDHETALYGAQDGLSGIILIAGTGSICYGVDESGNIHRTGGFGHLIDDEGSGYSIGRDLLSAAVQHYDGRIANTVITEMVYKQLSISSVQEIVGFVYNKSTNKKDIAALAPIMSQACELGDSAALRIAAKSAQALYELVVPVVEKLDYQEGRLAMAGSVLLKSEYVRSALTALLKQSYPKLDCILPKQDASYGAALMALRQAASTEK